MVKSKTIQVRARFSISREYYDQLKKFQRKFNYNIGEMVKLSLINTMNNLEQGGTLKMNA